MKDGYKTIEGYGEGEITINKSRFIGYAKPIEDEEEALEFIKAIQSMNKDATHNVYAYVLGEESNIQRFNDDGEPSGTAEIPVLEVLKKEDLRNVAVVVTRYFGGIKLGGGGLIRAYTKGAKLGIDGGNVVEMRCHIPIEISIDYTALGKVENYLNNKGIIIESIEYLQAVKISLNILATEMDKITGDIYNLTNGDAKIIELDKIFLPTKDGVRYLKK